MSIPAIFAIDGYKTGHRFQYPEGTEYVYSNLTPRSNRLFANSAFNFRKEGSPLIWMGGGAFVQEWFVEQFQGTFFKVDKDVVVPKFKKFMDMYIGKDQVPVDGIEALHDLGYLPLVVKQIPEGSWVNMKVPTVTIRNTIPEFFWLVNFLETLMSAELWPVATAATIAFNYRMIGQKYANKTCDNSDHLQWQFHDFSARGMPGIAANSLMGMGHLSSFFGTDSIYALYRLMEQYPSSDENYFYAASVNATEHSVMCMGTKEAELDTYSRLMNKVHPTGILSIVSDTWSYWNVMTKGLEKLKDEIVARDGKVVFRPDTGNPEWIICGEPHIDLTDKCEHRGHALTWMSRQDKYNLCKFKDDYLRLNFDGEIFSFTVEQEAVAIGSLELLWRTFGGIVNSKGFREINPKVGLIYGDSITLKTAPEILERMASIGFASNNIVLGIGSFSYQYNTRDTFGFAVKATWGVVNGEIREIYKDPETGDGLKKSAKGLMSHKLNGPVWEFKDCQTAIQESETELVTIFQDGDVMNLEGIDVIRARVSEATDTFLKLEEMLTK